MMTRVSQLLLLCFMAPPRPSSAQDSAVVAWIRETAIPLRTLNAGSGFEDLAPLKPVLMNARIVGLGESTHGTSEFQRAKHRLLEFLVKEMGYTAFAMEAGYSETQPMNDYVLHGTGNRADALSKLGYVAWDMEEFAAMVDWMRAYNRTVPEASRSSASRSRGALCRNSTWSSQMVLLRAPRSKVGRTVDGSVSLA